MLKYLDYATVKDEAFVRSELYQAFGGQPLTWDHLKAVLCAIEGVYLESLFQGQSYQGRVIETGEDFKRVHAQLSRLLMNKNNARFVNRKAELEEMRAKQDAAEGVTHRPRIDRRSA